MKKTYPLILLLLLGTGMAFADVRTPEQAAQIAAQALNKNAVSGPRRAPAQADQMQLVLTLNKQTVDLEVADGSRQPASARKNKISRRAKDSAQEADRQPRQTVHIEHGDNEPALYVFNTANNDGFAVVSADTRSVDILCYSDEGPVDTENMAPAFRWWLDRFVEEISSLTGEDDNSSAAPARAPQAAQATAVGPLLGNIAYDQKTPYNNLCPLDELRDNGRCYTGCVATAATQIMRFWQYPTHGNLRKTYQWMDMDYETYSHGYLSADFASATYDYANMLESYSGSYNATQANAVATLMYHAGVAAEMGYQADGSGAYNEVMANAFVTYFGYDLDGHLSTYDGDVVSAIQASINSDLSAGRPVFMGGRDASAGGHAFVCDGRNASGEFHFNWGWSGGGNCYTTLSSMHPENRTYYFNASLEAASGLRPATDCVVESHLYETIGTDQLPYVWRGQSLTEEGVYNDAVTVRENSCDTMGVLHLSIAPAGASRYGQCGDNLQWWLNEDETVLTFEGDGEMWDFTYSSDANNTVPWFSAHSTITSVVMPEGMLSTGDFAFIKCTNVSSFNLPSSLIWLGKYTFAFCNFSSITLPDALYGMDDAVFGRCENLTSITIPENVEYIAQNPFAYCSALTSVVWNAKNCASATVFERTPFYDVCSQITSFTFGNKVQKLPAAICYSMTNLTSVTIPASVTDIDQCAFVYCSGLTSITIPTNVAFIGINPFYGCTNLTSVVWNARNCASASKFAETPFYDIQTQITSFTFGNAVQVIPDGLCVGMSNLTSITIPSTISTVSSFLFYDCTGLTSVVIPENITAVGRSAFNGCSGITSLTIGSHVASIGIQAFWGLGISSVTIPASVTSIAREAFLNCGNLTSVVWNASACASPTSLTDAHFYAVRTQIKSLTFGSAVTSIPSYFCNGMTTLTSLRSENITPPTLGTNVFTSVPAAVPVTVPCGRQLAYKAASIWSNFTNYTTFGDEFPFTLTAGVQTEGTGTAAVTAKPDCSTNIATITATPAEHYHFLRWMDENANAESVGAVRNVTVTANASYTAIFEEDTKYTLTINNDGHGTASADKASYYEGETAILTIAPAEHYHFDSWTGTDSENISQTDDTHFAYTVGTENRTFTATFAEDYVQESHWYIKTQQSEDGDDWGWYEIAKNSNGEYVLERTYYGGGGVNFGTEPQVGGEDFITFESLGIAPVTGDLIRYTVNGAGTLSAEIIAGGDDSENVTVYAVNTFGWNTMGAYVWVDNTGYKVWPGEAMTNTGNQVNGYDIYTYTFPNTYTMIIFNEGYNGGSQTDDLVVNAAKPYFYDGQWYASLNDISTGAGTVTISVTANPSEGGSVYVYDGISAASSVEVEAGTTVRIYAEANDHYRFVRWDDGRTEESREITVTEDHAYVAYFEAISENVTVYAVNTFGWNTMGAYVWVDNTGYKVWPGEAMTNTGDQVNGYDIYSYTFPNTYTRIIFNEGYNGGSQTDDLVVNAAKPYFYADQWYASLNDIPTVAETVTITVTANPDEGYVDIYQSGVLLDYTDRDENGTVTEELELGTTIILQAWASDGYTFTGWSDGYTMAERTITVTGDATYTAYFEEIPYYTISVTANPSDGGSVEVGYDNFYSTSSVEVETGTTVWIYAEANYLYRFVHWDDGSTEEYREITATENHDYVAYFEEIPYYIISVTANPSEGGSVYVDDGISTTSSVKVETGTTVSIYAEANDRYRFVRWDDGSTEESREITATENHDYVAYFEEIPYYTISVTANPSDGGSVEVGYDNFYSTSSIEVETGTTVWIYAEANDRYRFVRWDDGSTDEYREFTATENHDYVATFEAIPYPYYTISVTANPSEGGSVYVDDGISTTSSVEVETGTTVWIYAEANDRYRFVRWDDGSTEESREITATENHDYVAYFEEILYYTISVTANPLDGGSVEVGYDNFYSTSSVEVETGTTVWIYAEANDRYRFVRWDDGSTDEYREFTATENHDYVATFEEIPYYTISVTANPSDGGSVEVGYDNFYSTSSIEVETGTTVWISAEANDRYRFVRWNDGSTDEYREFTATENHDYVATFEAIPYYTISVTADPSDGGRVEVGYDNFYSTSSIEVETGTTVWISAEANDRYRFVRWDDGSTDEYREITATENHDYVATFEAIPYYTISVTANPSEGGEVYIGTVGGGEVPARRNAPTNSSGSIEVETGTTVWISAEANDRYRFVRWDDGNTEEYREFTATENHDYVAYFEPLCTITVTANPKAGGFVTVSDEGYYYGPDGEAPQRRKAPADHDSSNSYYDGEIEVKVGTTVYLYAEAYNGYTFTGWSDGVTTAKREITAVGDATYTANFEWNLCTITVEVTPANSGWATVSDEGYVDYEGMEAPQRRKAPADWDYAGEDYGGELTVEIGTTVYLSAVPAPEYRFVRWSDGDTNARRTITATGDATYTAEFVWNGCEITITADPDEGSVGIYNEYGNLISYTDENGTVTIRKEIGTTITLKAEPNDGYTFTGWSDGVTTAEREITATGDATYTAIFEAIPYYTISVTANPSEGGIVSVDDGINTTSSVEVETGTTVRISAEANDRYRFVRWDDGSTEESREITATEDHAYVAYFEAIPYYTISVTANPSEGGIVSVDDGINTTSSVEVETGTTVRISAEANDRYRFVRWDDGSTEEYREFTATENHAYVAYFEALCEITVTAVPAVCGYVIMADDYDTDNGNGTATAIFEAGTTVSLEAVANEGYRFVRWSDGSTEALRTITVTENVTYVAEFGPYITFGIPQKGGSQSFSLTYTHVVPLDDTLSVKVNAWGMTEPLDIAVHPHSGVFFIDSLRSTDGFHGEARAYLHYTVNTTDNQITDTLVIRSSGVEKRMLLQADVFITEHHGTQDDPLSATDAYNLSRRPYSSYDSEMPADLYVRGEVSDIKIRDNYAALTVESTPGVSFNCYDEDDRAMIINCDVMVRDTVLVRVAKDAWSNARIISVTQQPAIDDAELALLRQAYAKMDNGSTWTRKWDLTSNATVRRTSDIMVTDGHVTKITLGYNGLQGTLPKELLQLPYLDYLAVHGNALTAIELPEAPNTSLTGLEISENQLSGNLGAITAKLPSLERLYATRNRFSEITPVIPATVTYLDISIQMIDETVELFIQEPMLLSTLQEKLPNIFFYNHKAQDYSRRLEHVIISGSAIAERQIPAWQSDWAWDSQGEGYYWTNHSAIPYRFTSTDELMLEDIGNDNDYFIQVRFTSLPGDVNFTGNNDVNDLQGMINEIFGMYDYSIAPFNFQAADMNQDAAVNVLDVVALVDDLLNQSLSGEEPISDEDDNDDEPLAPHRRAPQSDDAGTRLWWQNGELHLYSSFEIAALDIVTESRSAIEWLVQGYTVSQKTAGGMNHAVVYSLQGHTFAAGEEHIIARSGDAGSRIVRASLSDSRARAVSTSLQNTGEQTPTTLSETGDMQFFTSVDNRTVSLTATQAVENARWLVYDLAGKTIAEGTLTTVEEGTCRLTTLPVAGVYIISVNAGNRQVTDRIIVK